jgi:hypothetical protein
VGLLGYSVTGNTYCYLIWIVVDGRTTEVRQMAPNTANGQSAKGR